MRRCLLGIVACLVITSSARAAVVVVGNFSSGPVSFTITEPGQPPRSVKLAPNQVLPLTIAGPADLNFSDRAGVASRQIEPYHAYAFIPDKSLDIRFLGIDLPGKPPEQDAKPEPRPAPRKPVRIPVTLLVDEADPRADRLWQEALRKQFGEAAALIESNCGVRFEVAGFARWESAPAADLLGLLEDFEKRVAVKPGQIAIGWVSRKPPEKMNDGVFGTCRGFPATHIVIRNGWLTDPTEQVEVLVQQLGTALGAVPIPDPGSVMRPRLGDGLLRRPGVAMRFDPLNALVLNLWAEELRRKPTITAHEASDLGKARLSRVYRALLQESPDEPLARQYLEQFDPKLARGPKVDPPRPAFVDPARPKDLPPAANPQDDAARKVLFAVVARARANAEAGPNRLSGDALTVAYVRAAADAAAKLDEADRVSAFLLGLAIALDDTGALAGDPEAAKRIRGIEPSAARADRLDVIGTPTLRGRRDLCRRFATGCGAAELVPDGQLMDAAIGRLLSDQNRPGGLCFPNLAAEMAGVEFARTLRRDPARFDQLRSGFAVDHVLPALDGLRDGLSQDRFEEDYGDITDPRFKAVVVEIRRRLKGLSPDRP